MPTAQLIEVGIGACALLGALLAAWLWVRHWRIARRGTVALAAARRAGARWRYGLLRLHSDRLDFFALVGVTTRPRLSSSRESIEIGTAGASPSEVSGLVDPVLVTVTSPQGDWLLCLPKQVYPALRSWQESLPPGHRVNRT